MKATTTFAALLICVCFTAVAAAQQPSMMMISNDGLIAPQRPELRHSDFLGLTIETHSGRGLKVHSTERGKAGATIGLEPGDIILGAEGFYIDSLQQLESALNMGFGKATVTVVDIRTGRRVNAEMTLGSNFTGGITGTAVGYDPDLGIGLEYLFGDRNKVTSVEPNSPASRLGMTVGDIITSTRKEGVRVHFTYIDAETGYKYTAWYELPQPVPAPYPYP